VKTCRHDTEGQLRGRGVEVAQEQHVASGRLEVIDARLEQLQLQIAIAGIHSDRDPGDKVEIGMERVRIDEDEIAIW